MWVNIPNLKRLQWCISLKYLAISLGRWQNIKLFSLESLAFVGGKMHLSILFPPTYYVHLFSGSCSTCTCCPVREPTEQSQCTLTAVPIGEQTVGETTKGRAFVSERVPVQTSPCPPCPPRPPSSVNPHAHPYYSPIHANLARALQALFAKCLFINFQHRPPLQKSDYSSSSVRLHLSLYLSLSQLTVSPCAHEHANSLFVFISFFEISSFILFFPLLKWSEVSVHPVLLVWETGSWGPLLNAKYITVLF